MARDVDPKKRLLEATMSYVARCGVGEITLRQLAAAIGTSHRMLVYHFVSKEALLVEVVREVEKREREAVSRLIADSDLSAGEQMRRVWRRFSDPSLWPQERLFFEVYAHALQGRPHAKAILKDVIDAWLEPLTQAALTQGLSRQEANAEARLGVAVTRGLLLDLLATHDIRAVNRAMECFIRSYEARMVTSSKAK